MADKAALKERLDGMVERLANVGADVAEVWCGTILFKAPDLGTGWMVKMAMDGTVESLEERVDEEGATNIIEADSDTLLEIIGADISIWKLMLVDHNNLIKVWDPAA